MLINIYNIFFVHISSLIILKVIYHIQKQTNIKPVGKHWLLNGTGETLHMSQQDKSPLWIQSPEETSRV